ncbi:hypothetical protein C8Q74DRAFT_331218 [Fomes fomentarius]|nr:hypothetical protein C8Q74DRAFT_331218 [Fomes fomentarius]
MRESPSTLPIIFPHASLLFGFLEAKERILRLDRHPALFAIIVDYLSGYPILPLSARAIPHTMDMSTALRYLLADAQFYGLQSLCDLLASSKVPRELGWTGLENTTLSLEQALADDLPSGVVRKAGGKLADERSGLPVLVFAHDMIMRLMVTRQVWGYELNEPEADYSLRQFDAEFLSATLDNIARANAPFVRPLAEYVEGIYSPQTHPDCSMVIDGHQYPLYDIHAQCMARYSGMNMLQPPVLHTPLQWTTPSPDPTYQHA